MTATSMFIFISVFQDSELLNSYPTQSQNIFAAKDEPQVVVKEEHKKEEQIRWAIDREVIQPKLQNKEESSLTKLKILEEKNVRIPLEQQRNKNDYTSLNKVNVLEEELAGMPKQDETEEERSSYTNLDGSPYKWREHSLSEGLIYIHDQKLMKLPVGKRALEWLQKRCQGFELNLEGVRRGMCYKTHQHPLVSDQRICKGTKSHEKYENTKAVWAVSKENPLYEEDMYTLVVPAFLRINALVKSMEAFARCQQLSSYHVVWGNPDERAPIDVLRSTWEKLTKNIEDRKPLLHIHLMSVDTLNNRYLDLPGINTKAVVHIDDDQTTNCKEMWRMLTVWRAYPQQLVSPHVRAFSCWGTASGDGNFTIISDEKSTERVGFVYWGPIESPFRGFECALTKFAMAHRCFSALYSYGLEHHQGHIAGKAMVTKSLNGEDILFQGTASYATGLPPVFIQGIDIIDTGADDGSGISTRRNNNHFQARQQIVKKITKFLGFPWISQDFKIPKRFVNPSRPCPD